METFQVTLKHHQYLLQVMTGLHGVMALIYHSDQLKILSVLNGVFDLTHDQLVI